MNAEVVCAALEEWMIRNTIIGAVLMAFAALALAAGTGYRDMMRARLALRLASETVEVAWDLMADVLLFGAALIGFMLLSADVMSEVPLAVPLVPVATLAVLIALKLRTFHGGRVPGTHAWWATIALIGAACALHWMGLTFVTNGPGAGWLSQPPSSYWRFWHGLRSDTNPVLAMHTLVWSQPALLAAWLWLAGSGLRHVARPSVTRGGATGGRPGSHISIAPSRPEKRARLLILGGQCTGCAACIDVCPQQALAMDLTSFRPHLMDGRCDACMMCVAQCPTEAMRLSVESTTPGVSAHEAP